MQGHVGKPQDWSGGREMSGNMGKPREGMLNRFRIGSFG